MVQKPEFSIIIPTYNRSKFLRKTITSALAQTLQYWELIIVDDGSTDQTKELVENINDTRIRYVYQDNQGPATARNTGVIHSTADTIVYLDSDDCFYPTALEDISWALKDKNALYGLTNHNRTLKLVDNSGKEIARKFDSSGMNKSVTLEQIYNWEIKTTSSGLFHRKSLLGDDVRWRSGFWIEDLEFMMQLAVKAPLGFIHIPKVLVDYVQTYGADGLCSNATYNDWAHAFGSIYELHKNDPLMKKPEIYLSRVEKYKELHQKALHGEELPQIYKYFPEYWDRKNRV